MTPKNPKPPITNRWYIQLREYSFRTSSYHSPILDFLNLNLSPTKLKSDPFETLPGSKDRILVSSMWFSNITRPLMHPNMTQGHKSQQKWFLDAWKEYHSTQYFPWMYHVVESKQQQINNILSKKTCVGLYSLDSLLTFNTTFGRGEHNAIYVDPTTVDNLHGHLSPLFLMHTARWKNRMKRPFM